MKKSLSLTKNNLVLQLHLLESKRKPLHVSNILHNTVYVYVYL